MPRDILSPPPHKFNEEDGIINSLEERFYKATRRETLLTISPQELSILLRDRRDLEVIRTNVENLHEDCKEIIANALHLQIDRDDWRNQAVKAIALVEDVKALFPGLAEADLVDTIGEAMRDAKRISFLQTAALRSPTGISFDYTKGEGWRFMRKHFISDFASNLRQAIDYAWTQLWIKDRTYAEPINPTVDRF